MLRCFAASFIYCVAWKFYFIIFSRMFSWKKQTAHFWLLPEFGVKLGFGHCPFYGMCVWSRLHLHHSLFLILNSIKEDVFKILLLNLLLLWFGSEQKNRNKTTIDWNEMIKCFRQCVGNTWRFEIDQMIETTINI